MTTIRQTAPVRAVILLFLVLATASLSACYTLMQHRRVASIDYRRPQGKSCTGCHTSREVGGYLQPARLAPDPSPWDALYRPWWLPADSTGGDG